MAYQFYLDGVQLPVAPSKLSLKIKNQNKTMNLINESEVNALKLPGLTEVSFDFMIPHAAYPFAEYPGGFKPPKYYLDKLEALKIGKKPFQFIVSRASPGGERYFGTDLKVSLEDYTITEDAGNGFDLSVSVKLKQYRDYGAKLVTVIEDSAGQKTAEVKEARPAESKPEAKTYTVQKNVLSYLPPVLQEVYEMRGLSQAENSELNKLWQGTEDAMNDQFVETATENGVSRWESMLKIAPKATDTLTERKLNILVKLSGQHSYTLTVLDQQLESICGTGNYTVSVDYGAYTLSVRIALASASNYDAVQDLLERVVPANMVIDLSLLYHQYGDYKTYTHTQLTPYTHQQLREEELS